MAWTAPLTAATDAELTAAQWNSNIRDNLRETLPSKANNPRAYQNIPTGAYFATEDANSMVERQILHWIVYSRQSRSFSSYGNLHTGGPSVVVETGTEALVFAQCTMRNDSNTGQSAFAVEVSGASDVSADDDWCGRIEGIAANNAFRVGVAHRFTGLTAGRNRFTVKYRSDGGSTATFEDRNICVWPW